MGGLSANRLAGYLVRLAMSLIWLVCPVSAIAETACIPQVFEVVMATPFSSRIDRVGDALQAVLVRPLVWGPNQVMPSGTLLKGRVSAVKPAGRGAIAQIGIKFSEAIQAMAGSQQVFVVLATPDGWLRQTDADTDVWKISPTRSTRLLNTRVQGRLGTNRALWAQMLGINQNIIPDPGTDEFIRTYNRNDVLVGAGDRLKLWFLCY